MFLKRSTCVCLKLMCVLNPDYTVLNNRFIRHAAALEVEDCMHKIPTIIQNQSPIRLLPYKFKDTTHALYSIDRTWE